MFNYKPNDNAKPKGDDGADNDSALNTCLENDAITRSEFDASDLPYIWHITTVAVGAAKDKGGDDHVIVACIQVTGNN